MYSCPTDDIHSVYLDGELPQAYIKEYEEHLETCESCRKKLENLKTLRSVLKNGEPQCDEVFMQKSFERLQTKLKYTNHTKYVQKFPVQKIASYSVACAAAVLIAVILPFGGSNKKSAGYDKGSRGENVAQISPVSRPQNRLISNNNIVINGNINDNLAHNVSTGSLDTPVLRDVDVFRPDFENKDFISIKIAVPGMIQQQNLIEVKLPVSSISGLINE